MEGTLPPGGALGVGTGVQLEAPAAAWVWAKTAPEAIRILEAVDVIEASLDHDLGPEDEVGTGYDVLKWIEERVALNETYQPPAIHIHTSNIGARDRMESAVRGITNLLARRTEEADASWALSL